MGLAVAPRLEYNMMSSKRITVYGPTKRDETIGFIAFTWNQSDCMPLSRHCENFQGR